MKNPLNDIVVLDLSRILAGPWATQFLADMGARVIKVEKPKTGDDTRQWGPPNLVANDDETLVSAYFLSANRGKESVSIDISTEEGQALVKALAKKADVFVENFKVGALKNYLLDYLSLKEVNPSLIYCSITGFGQTGPNAQLPGYDAMIQAQAGLMSITGEADGAPMKTGVAVSDLMTGMYATSAILSALYQRKNTGAGCHIDLSLYDTQMAWLANQSMNYFISKTVPMRHGNAHPNIVPYETFKTSDGFITIAVGNDAQFQRLAIEVGEPSLGTLEKFATNLSRVKHRTELIDLLSERIQLKSTNEWIIGLNNASIPVGKVQNIDEAVHDQQTVSRQLVKEFENEQYGSFEQLVNPIRFDNTQQYSSLAPPTLGQSTERVLSELLDCSEQYIHNLKENNIIG